MTTAVFNKADTLATIFRAAAATVRTSWVVSFQNSRTAAKPVQAAFRDAYDAATVQLNMWGLHNDLTYPQSCALSSMRRICEGTDPRGGNFLDLAISASAQVTEVALDAAMTALAAHAKAS